ncbi:MAG: ATP-dependent RecD-like DNA helicase [Eubacteriales bacterium]|nr:ATP-dependent RecD-like DNA helicase [Eubacteriales bacterium]
MADTIEGYVEHIIYRNDENGYTVMQVEAQNDDMTVVGVFPNINEGEYISAEGEYTFHATYGQQFKAAHAEVTVPRQKIALERYLGSGAIKGIGPTLAERIIRHFGDDTLRIMEEEPERLEEVKGISSRKAREIGEQIEEKSQMQNAMIYLAQYGISLTLGIKIYNQYQDRLYQVLRENPYQLAEDIQGVGFRIADEIAAQIGFRPDSEFRVRSGLLFVLNQAGGEGHIYLPENVLFERAGELLGCSIEMMEQCLTDLSIDRKVVLRELEGMDGERTALVYTTQSYFTELNAARMLNDLNIDTGESEEVIEKQIRAIEKKDKICLDDMQREAVITAARSGIVVLTGGPGTGKTTTINTMIRYFLSERMSIALAAPTGRAAKRMTEATGYEASTIHRLLEISGLVEDENTAVRFERNADNPLEQDVIIIDEMSMVDIYLMHALLQAIVPGTRLILVGDRNQLPSVGPGSVLRDVIRAGVFPVITLEKIFRQAQESDIVVNAHRINAGLPVSLDNKSKDFFFLKREEVRVAQRVVLALVQDKLPGVVGADSTDIQVLTPTRKGELGVESLNRILQRYLNPPEPGKQEREAAQGIFREGDKVMQIRNDYQLEWEVKGKYGITAQHGLGVFNGDMGIIKRIDPGNEIVTVEYEEGKQVEYTYKQLDELELAYATTVHKAQGSEYPAVVIPLLGVPKMLQTRNLLYTAVTRARKCVVLTGSPDTFQAMIDNRTEEKRYTTLAERILEIHAGF